MTNTTLFYSQVEEVLAALSEAMDVLEESPLIESTNRMGAILLAAQDIRDEVLAMIDLEAGGH